MQHVQPVSLHASSRHALPFFRGEMHSMTGSTDRNFHLNYQGFRLNDDQPTAFRPTHELTDM